MLSNYLKVFFRNTIKNPFYSAINIIGLSIGIACSLVAFLYILNEVNYNKCFDGSERIYRIGAGIESEMLNDSMARTLPQVAPTIKERVPEIEAATRMVTWYRNSLIKVNQEFYPNVKSIIADSALLDVFSFEIVRGDRENFLKSPTQIAITESLAKKVFKEQDPMHQIINFQDVDLEVAWIMKDPPNSIIEFDLLANLDFKSPFKEYLRLDVSTFFKTSKKLTPEVESKIRKVSDKIILDMFSQWTNKTNSPIQPFEELYLKSNLKDEMGKEGSLRTIYIFGFLAFIILVIAVINYVNLLTSRSEYRNKEVGIRKVAGADKRKLRFQFLGESVILSFLALIIGFVIAEFIIYLVNAKLNIDLSLFGQSNIWLFLAYIVITIFIGIISGIYPSFVMAGYSPLKVIKGIFDAEGNSNFLKIVLVIIQFSISTLLIISIFTFNSQIKYLKNKELGFNDKNLLILPNCTEQIQESYESIRNDLLTYHKIKNVSASQSIPGEGRSGQAIRKKTDDPDKVSFISENRVQDHFIETMGIEVIKGRSFDPEFDDSRSILINETGAKLLKVDDPVGLEVFTTKEAVIIGVVKDYHFTPTTRELGPLYLSNYSDYIKYMEIRIDPEDKLATLQYVKELIQKYDPNYYWNYFFIDDMFSNQYRAEERLFSMIFWGSGIALILSILGLFALTSYTVTKKYKEIGIRKTFGASITNIIGKLNRDIIRWVLLTNIIAWPAAYFIMNNWLQNYPYRVDLNWLHFVLASVISLVIAFLTISFQAYKAARMNPVDAIRYE
ncbi:MAG: ABC transporter permease [Bacteroidetes bacterium]|nr:ABC transporter permease [Bacteroidota bacterium]